jgi:hypothetical protein
MKEKIKDYFCLFCFVILLLTACIWIIIEKPILALLQFVEEMNDSISEKMDDLVFKCCADPLVLLGVTISVLLAWAGSGIYLFISLIHAPGSYSIHLLAFAICSVYCFHFVRQAMIDLSDFLDNL